MVANLYRLFSLLGALSMWAAFVWGFRYYGGADSMNYAINLGIYLAFIIVHLAMTRSWFKKAVYGKAEGTPVERRVYIVISIITWVAVLYYHRELPGFDLGLPAPVRFLGLCILFMGAISFFSGADPKAFDAMFAVPGAEMSHSHGAETPLMTEGPYGKVRHPMYASVVIALIGSFIYHPNAAQLFWLALIGLSFILFIPIEEKQLEQQRGQAYADYKLKVRWRLFKGIW